MYIEEHVDLGSYGHSTSTSWNRTHPAHSSACIDHAKCVKQVEVEHSTCADAPVMHAYAEVPHNLWCLKFPEFPVSCAKSQASYLHTALLISRRCHSPLKCAWCQSHKKHPGCPILEVIPAHMKVSPPRLEALSASRVVCTRLALAKVGWCILD